MGLLPTMHMVLILTINMMVLLFTIRSMDVLVPVGMPVLLLSPFHLDHSPGPSLLRRFWRSSP